MPRELDSTLKTAVKGTTLILAGMVAGNLLWFAIKVIIVRNVTVEQFGLYSLAVTISAVLTSVAPLGTPSGTTRNVSAYLAQGRRQEAEGLSRASLHISLASSAAACLLLIALSGLAARHLFYKPELAPALRVIALTIPLNSLSAAEGSIMRGHGIIRQKVYYQDFGHPLYFLCFLGLLLLWHFSLTSLIYALTASTALVFVSISSYGYKKLGIRPVPARRGMHYSELLKFSFPLLVAGMSALVLSWTDTLMLGRYTPPESVGIYSVAMSLARLLVFSMTAMGFVFLPLATEMHARGRREELGRNYQVITKWVFATTLPLFFILFFFPETTITFLFGEELLGASAPLRILALGFLFHVFLGTNGMLLMAMGMTKTIMRISILGAAVNVVLNYILIKRLGMGVTGAAAATLVSYVAINALNSTVLYRTSGIHPFTVKYLKPLAGASVIGVVIYLLAKKVVFSFWLMPAYLVLFVGGYVLSLLLSRSLDREDIELFEAVSRKTGLRMEWMRRILNRFAHE